MDAKIVGRTAGLILWPGLAGLALWLLTGSMPASVEQILAGLLWVLAGTLLFAVFAGALVSILSSHARRRPDESGRLDRVFFWIVTPSRLVLILALFFVGRPILGSCFLGGFLGLAVVRSYHAKRLGQAEASKEAC